MDYRQLGGSGLKVPVLTFGTGTFGGAGEFFKSWGASDVAEATRRSGGRRTAIVLAAAWIVVVVGSQVLAAATGRPDVGFPAALVRAGALVFGGGHGVLPLLDAGVVAPGWVTPDAFLAGYGAAQALPGPLFSFGAYLGAVSTAGPGGLAGVERRIETGHGLAVGIIVFGVVMLVLGRRA